MFLGIKGHALLAKHISIALKIALYSEMSKRRYSREMHAKKE